MKHGLTNGHEYPNRVTTSVISSVILNLFQDLRRCSVRGSRNKFGMTLAVLSSLLILQACGYHMAGTGSHLTAGVKSIFIPVFENKTMEPIIEEELTTAVIREFLKDGRIEVGESSRADMVLRGSVVAYKETPVSFDAAQNVLEYRVTVTTHLTLLDTNKLWEQDVTSTAEYTVSSDVMTTRIKKLSALREIARNLSEEVADRVLLGW